MKDNRKGNVKTLLNIQEDMSELYEEVRAGNTDLKAAAELANIAGKFLKAEQLKLAREIFTSASNSRLTRNAETSTALTLASSK
jgi:hypothetical protein